MKVLSRSLVILFFALFLFAQESWAKELEGKININTASISQITLLPGLGEKKAQSIVDFRSKKKFTKAEELLEIKGIGDALLSKIKDYLIFQGPSNLKEK